MCVCVCVRERERERGRERGGGRVGAFTVSGCFSLQMALPTLE